MKWQKLAARSQVVHQSLCLLIVAVLIFLPQGRAQARLRLDAKAVLRLPVSEMVLENAEVIVIVEKLEQQFNVPVNFIQAVQDNPTTINVVDGTAHDVLNQILRQNPMYRLRKLKGRLILMPTSAQFDTKIGGIAIKNVPHEQATNDYLAILKKQKGFEAIEGLATGPGGRLVYTTPVTLSRNASVIEHFVELLGTDELLLFSLQKGVHDRGKWLGGYLFWYGNVRGSLPVNDRLPIGFSLPSSIASVKTTFKRVSGRLELAQTPASLTQIAGGSQFIIAIHVEVNGSVDTPLLCQVESSPPTAAPNFFSSLVDTPTPQQIIANYAQVVQSHIQRRYQTAIYILVETNQVLHDVDLNFVITSKVGSRVIHRARGSILITRFP